MSRGSLRHRDPPALDEREADVLRSVIESHVLSGEPVGSVHVAHEAGLRVSPATIRAIMGRLEERGLLTQPHASAGRTPTEEAYRLYVDRLLRRRPVSRSAATRIEEALGRDTNEVKELLAEASRQLSRISRHVGVVLAPDLGAIVLDRLEFVRVGARRVVAILIARSGLVEHRVVRTEEELEPTELERIGAYLSEQFGGQTLPEMHEELIRRLSEERAAYDRLVARSFALGRRALAGEPEGQVFVDGAWNLIGFPEFADAERMRTLLRGLEQKRRLAALLRRLLHGDGVQVVIGEENPVEALAGCSLVASTYRSGDRAIGALGIVGPTRMPYPKMIALVEYSARALGRAIGGDPTEAKTES